MRLLICAIMVVAMGHGCYEGPNAGMVKSAGGDGDQQQGNEPVEAGSSGVANVSGAPPAVDLTGFPQGVYFISAPKSNRLVTRLGSGGQYTKYDEEVKVRLNLNIEASDEHPSFFRVDVIGNDDSCATYKYEYEVNTNIDRSNIAKVSDKGWEILMRNYTDNSYSGKYGTELFVQLGESERIDKETGEVSGIFEGKAILVERANIITWFQRSVNTG